MAEIASLQQLEKDNACASVVVGSTEILSPVEFLRMLGSKVDLVKPIKRDFNLSMHGQTAIQVGDAHEIKEIIVEMPREAKEEKKSGGVFGFIRKKTKTKADDF